MPTANAQEAFDRSLSALVALIAGAMVLFLVAPRTSPGVLGLMALAVGLGGGLAAGWSAVVGGLLPRILLLLALWSLISVGWAADRGEAVNKSLLLVLIVVAAAWTTNAVRLVPEGLLRHLGKVALIAFSVGLAYLLVEEAFDHRIKRAVLSSLPFALPAVKHIVDSPDGVVVSGYISNRNMAAMTLALWPMLLIAWLSLDRSRRVLPIALVLMLAAITLALSKHETSAIALVLSAAVFGLCHFQPRMGLGLLAVGWVAVTLLVVPLASWAGHGARLHEASWLPNSARHRIVLWAYTADQVWQRPMHGVGAASTKRIDQQRGAHVELLPGTRYQWRSGPHAHSVYLQTWYELGAIGAALLCAAGLALIATLARLPAASVAMASASFAAAAVIAAFSWGMWQAWFLAIFAVGASLTALAAELARSRQADAGAA